MSDYQTKNEQVSVPGVADLAIRSLLDREQFDDPLGVAERMGISSATWPLFGLLWPSGALLAARMAARQVSPGERVLESRLWAGPREPGRPSTRCRHDGQ